MGDFGLGLLAGLLIGLMIEWLVDWRAWRPPRFMGAAARRQPPLPTPSATPPSNANGQTTAGEPE
jgi:hypothetical protein